MIYFLVFRQPLVEVGLACGVRPQHVPVVPVRALHPIEFKHEFDQSGVAVEHFEAGVRVFALEGFFRVHV